MTIMKKTLALILAAVLVIALLGLYGCHPAAPQATEPTAATEATETTAATAPAETEAPTEASTEPVETEAPTEVPTEAPTEPNTAGNNKPQGGTDQPGTTGTSNGQQTGSAGTGSGNTSGAPVETQPPVTEHGEHVHNYFFGNTIPATCTSEGITTYYCDCGDSYTETIPMIDHNYTVANTVPATCTQDGSVTYTCTGCGDSYTEVIPAAHVWVHHHEDEVGHEIGNLACRCGAIFYSVDEWGAHVDSFDNLEALMYHGGYATGSTWIVDTPARDWDECSVCGAIK